jgi:hypothetical protein
MGDLSSHERICPVHTEYDPSLIVFEPMREFKAARQYMLSLEWSPHIDVRPCLDDFHYLFYFQKFEFSSELI